jgi:hypothetical protein
MYIQPTAIFYKLPTFCQYPYRLKATRPTKNEPLGKETMARLINFAITKPEPTDEQ